MAACANVSLSISATLYPCIHTVTLTIGRHARVPPHSPRRKTPAPARKHPKAECGKKRSGHVARRRCAPPPTHHSRSPATHAMQLSRSGRPPFLLLLYPIGHATRNGEGQGRTIGGLGGRSIYACVRAHRSCTSLRHPHGCCWARIPAASHTQMASWRTARTCAVLAPPLSAPFRWPFSWGLTWFAGALG